MTMHRQIQLAGTLHRLRREADGYEAAVANVREILRPAVAARFARRQGRVLRLVERIRAALNAARPA